ncbi:hypothetical protein Zm00014a_006770 [Zea mays]|uniref:Uncharacterized protein n=1 Tax=Zea mays TaxID=4577 RepID=A0A3L6G3U5_MAIZE|nr:hypothetical protein Zm00014a_006770 [Zea mays]
MIANAVILVSSTIYIWKIKDKKRAYPVWKTPTCVVSKEEINEVFFGEIPDSSLI